MNLYFIFSSTENIILDSVKPHLSVVATIYRAEQAIPELVERIKIATEKITSDFEIILVDDVSPDRSWEAIQQQASKDKRVKGIQLSRNFGQQIAMSAGIRFATGDFVLIMDGDLQNPPEAIPDFYNKIKEGFDIVYGTSVKRNDLKDEFTSRLLWYAVSKIFKVKIIKDQVMMRIMTGEFAKRFNEYNEINRVIAGITNDIGMKMAVINVDNQKRKYGKSNYNFYKRFNLMIDFIMFFTNAPLNMLINISLITLLLTTLVSVYYIILKLFFTVQPGYTSILLTIFFFGSLILLVLGIIGRYLSNIYTEVRRRPLFFVQEKANL